MGEPTKDFESLIFPTAICLLIYSRSTASSFSLRGYIGPYGGVEPSMSLISWSQVVTQVMTGGRRVLLKDTGGAASG